jgi:hypothetical protein
VYLVSSEVFVSWQPELTYVILDAGEKNFLEEIANSVGETGGLSGGILPFPVLLLIKCERLSMAVGSDACGQQW